MDALKRKVKETIEDTERAENRYKYLLRHLRQAKERADLADEEVEALKQRIKERKEDLNNSYGMIQDKQQHHQTKEADGRREWGNQEESGI